MQIRLSALARIISGGRRIWNPRFYRKRHSKIRRTIVKGYAYVRTCIAQGAPTRCTRGLREQVALRAAAHGRRTQAVTRIRSSNARAFLRGCGRSFSMYVARTGVFPHGCAESLRRPLPQRNCPLRGSTSAREDHNAHMQQ